MRRSTLVLMTGCHVLLTTALSSCTSARQKQGGAYAVQHPKRAVTIAMDRQVHNAIDAGEGDILTRVLRQKVTADPNDFNARLELAEQYRRQGAFELAIDHLRIAAERKPDSETAVLSLAQALRANEQPVEAIAALVRYCDTHATASSALLTETAIAQDESGALTEGERFHRRAIEVDRQDDRLRNNLGYNFLQQGKLGDAVHEFKAALMLNSTSEAARNNMGFALARLGQSEDALLHWSSISGPAAAHSNLAAVLIDKGDLAGARKEIQAALEYDRHNPAAMRNLQLVAELDGRPASFTINSNVAATKPAGWARVPAMFGRLIGGESRTSPKQQQAISEAAKTGQQQQVK
jgi:Flp pilus assembly protein TadD